MNKIDTFNKNQKFIKITLMIIFFGSLSLFTANILSYPYGKTGHTATNGQGCYCHSTSANTGVSLSLSGSTTVLPNSTTNYTLTVNQSLGKVLAGVNIAARQSQNGTVINNLSTTDSYLQLSGSELTHRASPNNKAFTGGSASFDFSFTAPSTPGTYYIQAISLAANGNGTDDAGDVWNWLTPVAITVSAPSQTLTLINPSGGQDLCQNQTYNITWTSTNVTNVKIELSTDGGSTFPNTLIASTSASTGSWAWTISNSLLGANNKIRISDAANSSLNSVSTSAFTINPLASITEQPSSQSVCQGQNVTFRVAATGGGLNYQWRKNGTVIPASNTNSLNLTQLVKADEGTYDCIINSSCGAPITSNAAILTVKAAPAITSHPQAVTTCVGQPVTFTVTATGENLNYTWMKNGLPITAPNSNTLTLSSVGIADSGSYTCNVNGTCSPQASSNPAKLIVNASPTITKQPLSSLNVCLGSRIELTVDAVGGDLQYLWKRNGLPVDGQTSSKLVIQSAGTIDQGTYTCLITSNCGNPSITNPSTVNVFKAVSITEQPASNTLFIGDSLTLKVVASNGGTLAYQWRKNDKNIAGKTQNVLTIPNLSANDAGNYDCIITAQCGGDVISSTAAITVKDKPTGPKLTLTSNSISCDSIVIGETPTPKVFNGIVRNSGSQDLTISSAQITGVDSAAFNLNATLPLVLKSNESISISITFTPTKPGIHIASLTFTSNSQDNPSLSLSGFGLSMNVTSQSGTVNFSNVELNKTKKNSILIKNQSNIPAEIYQITFADPDGKDFILDNSVKLPVSVDIGSNFELPINFTPSVLKDYNVLAKVYVKFVKNPIEVNLIGSTVLDVTESTLNNLNVRPNPSRQTISIELEKEFREINYRIFNNSGKLVYSNEILNSKIIEWNGKDLLNNNCESGIYRCSILADGKIMFVSIIIEK